MFESKKSILIGVLLLGIIAMTVAFAALSTNLRINGTASIPSLSWNIHFANWQLDTANTVTVGGITHQNTAVYPTVNQLSQSISVANSTKVEGINVELYQPGDYVRYTFNIINDGTIDASLDQFSYNLVCASGKDCSHLTYEVLCNDALSGGNNVLVEHSTLAKNGGTAYCSLEVRYNDQTNNNTVGNNQIYEQGAASATLDASWAYVQKVDDNNSQSGGGQSGGSESNLPPEIPSNATFYYSDGTTMQTTSEYNQNWRIWGQESNGVKQACGKFENGSVVCLESDKWDGDQVEPTGQVTEYGQRIYRYVNSSYVAGKQSEIEGKGGRCWVTSSVLNCWSDDEVLILNVGKMGNFGLVQEELDVDNYCSVSTGNQLECSISTD